VGSTFKVEVAASGPAKPLAEESEGCILVIDDRQDVLGSLVEVIAELGYGAESALTAGAASNLLASRTYDAVFFDLQMPVKSGAELATEIRRGDGPNRGTRFIAMTAADESDAGRQWPFDDFVRKPIAARRLKRLLAAPIPSRVPRR
jgi:CheY-like chemotaxis protein